MSVVLASFLIHLVLARLLPQADFGTFLVVYSLVALFAVVTSLGLPNTLLRTTREQLTLERPGSLRVQIDRMLVIWLGSAVLTGTGFCLLVLAFGERVFSIDLFAHCGWGAALIVLASFRRMAAEICRGFEDFRWSALLGLKQGGILQQAIALAGLAALAMTGRLSLDAAFLVMTVAAAVPVILVLPRLVQLRSGLPPMPAADDEPTRGVSVLGMSLPVMVSDLSLLALKHFDVLVVGALMTPADLAVYGVAKRFAILVGTPLLIGNTTMSSFIPDLFVVRDRVGLERLVRSTATIAAIPSMLVLLVMLVAPGFVLATFFGEPYRSGATVLALLCIGALVSSIVGGCATTLVMTGHQRLSMLNSLGTGLLHVLLAPILVTQHGLTGAAAAMMITVSLKNVVGLLLVRETVGIWSMVSLSPSFVRSLLDRTCRALAPAWADPRRR